MKLHNKLTLLALLLVEVLTIRGCITSTDPINAQPILAVVSVILGVFILFMTNIVFRNYKN
jgi:hypothetical protein